MRTPTLWIIAVVLSLLITPLLLSAARVGEPAPVFSGTDTKGKTHTLADLKGKWVVLEWHNNGCPYVKRQYGTGNMQALQKEWTGKGVVWLTVISSAPGQQGYVTAAEADQYAASSHAAATAILLDPTGDLGRQYEAKTTPHMYVINPAGVLIYNGALDSKATSDPSDSPATAANYVSTALVESMAGKPVTTPATRPYGCGVKYAAR
jgi:peroxiredoxin